MRLHKRMFLVASGLALVLLPARPAGAIWFEWDAEGGWPGGTTNFNNVYTDIAGIPGLDLEVDVVNGAPLVDVSPDGSPPSLEVNSFLLPPTNVGSSLFVRAQGNGVGSGVTFDYDFTGVVGMSEVIFGIFDIDANNPPDQWIDVLVVTGFALGGGTVTPTVTPVGGAVPSWSYDSGTGTITGDPAFGNQGNGNDVGTALVTFSAPITGFSITYRNDVNSGGNQWVSFTDIWFVPIPEPGTGVLAVAALAGLAGLRRR